MDRFTEPEEIELALENFSKVSKEITEEARVLIDKYAPENFGEEIDALSEAICYLFDKSIDAKTAYGKIQDNFERYSNSIKNIEAKILINELNVSKETLNCLNAVVSASVIMLNTFNLETVEKMKIVSKEINELFKDEEIEMGKDDFVDKTFTEAETFFNKLDEASQDEINKIEKEEEEKCDGLFCNKYVKYSALALGVAGLIGGTYFLTKKHILKNVIDVGDSNEV